eukprot:6178385-Prymnesium_polylepis.1
MLFCFLASSLFAFTVHGDRSDPPDRIGAEISLFAVSVSLSCFSAVSLSFFSFWLFPRGREEYGLRNLAMRSRLSALRSRPTDPGWLDVGCFESVGADRPTLAARSAAKMYEVLFWPIMSLTSRVCSAG